MDQNNKRTRWITAIVLMAGIVMIVFGAARGEALTVLTKATSICMQCIGID